MTRFSGPAVPPLLIAAAVSFIAVNAYAQDQQNQTSQNQGTRFILGEVTEIVISGNQRGDRAEIPGSVDLLNRDQLRDEHVNLTMDLFKKVPGVSFYRFNQGIISADITIRGFNAEGTAPSTKLLIDGIPSNLHVGVPEMDALFPIEIDNIEVVKGTNDPRYGLMNIAGNINMTSRRDVATEFEVLGGSFNTTEVQAYHGAESGALSQHYFVGHRRTDGYRDNSGLDKTALSGKWFYDVSDNLNIGLIARYSDFSADAPGYLSREEARATPTRSYAFSATDGGDKTTQHLSLHADYALNQQWRWNTKLYLQNFERHRWVRFTAQDAQQERYEDEDQRGLISTLSWRPSEHRLVNFGVDYNTQDNLHQRLSSNNRQRTGQVLRNHQFDFDVLGGYLQWQEDITTRLRLITGLRADRLYGDFVDRNSGARRDIMDYGTIWQPKVSALYQLTDRMDLFANAGRSFQTGIGAGAYAAPGDDLNVSVNDGWDVGVSYQPIDALSMRLSRWRQTASDEVVAKPDGSGDFENAGETARDGWELAIRLWPSEALSIWGSYSLQEAVLTDPGPANAALRGNELDHIPAYTASLGLEYRYEQWKATLFTSMQGDYELDSSNDRGRYGDYVLTDLTLLRTMSWGSISFRVNNVFDRYYEYAWHDVFFSGENLFSPGVERSFDVALAWRF